MRAEMRIRSSPGRFTFAGLKGVTTTMVAYGLCLVVAIAPVLVAGANNLSISGRSIRSTRTHHAAADQYHRSTSLAGLTVTDTEKIYVLHKVPPFEATLTFPDPGFYNHRGQTALMDIDESLDAITSRYLFDFVYRYMEGMSRQHGRPLGQKLHSLEVRSDLYEVDDQGNILAGPNVDGRGRKLRLGRQRRTSGYIPGARPSSNADQYENLPPKYIVAEFTGTASFEDYRYDPADFDVVPGESGGEGESGINSEDDVVIDVDEHVLRLMIGKALKQTNAYLQELWTATDHLVASVQEADLRMDLDLALEASDGFVSGGAGAGAGAGKDQSDFYYGAPPASSNSGGTATPSGAQPTSADRASVASSTSFPTPTNNGLSTKESATISVMAVFLAFFVGFIYMYMKREYRHGGGHGGPSKNRRGGGGGGGDDDHGTMNAALRRNHDGSLEFRDDWGEDTVGAVGGPAYPIGTGAPPVSSRLYANPNNSEQVMYGASFTPSETEKVQAYYAAQRRDVPKKKSKRNLTLISPMMSVVEEEAPPPPPSRFSELPRSRNGHQLGATNHHHSQKNDAPSVLPQVSPSNIMQNVSSFFGSMSLSPNGGDGRTSQISPTGVESFIAPVPYKDFPRNDGTPCVMFSDHSSGWEVSAEAREAAETEALTAMSVEVGVSGIRETSNSVHSVDEPIITEEGIENFVDKLEHLMTLKERQYKERVKMEQERAQRKKDRKERRRKGPEGSNKVVALSNPQAPSVGSPPSSKHGEEHKKKLGTHTFQMP